MKKLLTPRWLFGHLLALALVALFINFGFWQLRRLAQRDAYNALLETRLDAPPRPYTDLERRTSATAPVTDPDSVAYRRASVSGRYDPANEVLLRSRALDGQPGYHVLTPLRFAENRALLVDRGWVPFEFDEPPVTEAAPPESVQVTGVLQPAQVQPAGGGVLDRLGLVQQDPAEGELDAVFFVNPARIGRGLPYALEPVFLELATQTPAQRGQLPVPPPPLEITRGSHLAYALQWFSFALIGVVGYAALLRGVLREPSEHLADDLRLDDPYMDDPEPETGNDPGA